VQNIENNVYHSFGQLSERASTPYPPLFDRPMHFLKPEPFTGGVNYFEGDTPLQHRFCSGKKVTLNVVAERGTEDMQIIPNKPVKLPPIGQQQENKENIPQPLEDLFHNMCARRRTEDSIAETKAMAAGYEEGVEGAQAHAKPQLVGAQSRYDKRKFSTMERIPPAMPVCSRQVKLDLKIDPLSEQTDEYHGKLPKLVDPACQMASAKCFGYTKMDAESGEDSEDQINSDEDHNKKPKKRSNSFKAFKSKILKPFRKHRDPK
jgi:hypothetical protein